MTLTLTLSRRRERDTYDLFRKREREIYASRVRDRGATRSLVLGALSLPFGLLAPFAIWSGSSSLRRIRSSGGQVTGSWSAALGVAAGIVGAAFGIGGVVFWLFLS